MLWAKRPGTPGGPTERALRRPPVRPDVYADQADWADHTNPFREAGGFNQRAEWMALMTELRLVWAAAWVDGREALLEADRAVLAVPDAAARARLREQLAHVPISMSDVAAIREERKKREGTDAVGLEMWKAQQRVELAEKFRRHYRDVKAAAEKAVPGSG